MKLGRHFSQLCFLMVSDLASFNDRVEPIIAMRVHYTAEGQISNSDPFDRSCRMDG